MGLDLVLECLFLALDTCFLVNPKNPKTTQKSIVGLAPILNNSHRELEWMQAVHHSWLLSSLSEAIAAIKEVLIASASCPADWASTLTAAWSLSVSTTTCLSLFDPSLFFPFVGFFFLPLHFLACELPNVQPYVHLSNSSMFSH